MQASSSSKTCLLPTLWEKKGLRAGTFNMPTSHWSYFFISSSPQPSMKQKEQSLEIGGVSGMGQRGHIALWDLSTCFSYNRAAGFKGFLKQSSLYWILKWKPEVESQLSQDRPFPLFSTVTDGRWFPGFPKEGLHLFAHCILYWLKNKPPSVVNVLHSGEKNK